ncbi:Formyltransferase [Fomitopsis betulina]|nr:Formyltransferase [Fomitopsis betulina]
MAATHPFLRPCLSCRRQLQLLQSTKQCRRDNLRNGVVIPRGYHSRSPSQELFKVLYLGRDEFSCLVLEELHRAKDVWQELAIVTTPDIKVGRRGSKLAVSPLKVLGEHLDLPIHFIPPGKASVLKTWQPPSPFAEPESPPASHVIITASFGHILPKRILELFLPSRRLNVHPSLLPEYRGAAPIQHTIMDGLKDTGVSVVEMLERSKGIDAGALWGQERVAIPEGVTYSELRDITAQKGGELLVSVLRDMIEGKATLRPQTEDAVSPRSPMITPEDAIVDFDTMTAEQIARRSRAFSHQRPLITALKNKRQMQLHGVSTPHTGQAEALKQLPMPGTAIYDQTANALLIRCASDTVIAVSEVKQQDRTLLKAREWWNGVRPDFRVHAGAEGPVQFLRPVAAHP